MTITAPGLRIRPRKGGAAYYWIPRADAVKAGYPSGTVNLTHLADGSAEGEALIRSKCEDLQREMLYWLAGYRRDRSAFDGTIGSVLNIYETHADSPYRNLKPGSLRAYGSYLRRLRTHVGPRLIANVTGYDVQQWWRAWSDADARGKPRKVAAGSLAMKVLKGAIKWGAVLDLEGCAAFYERLKLLEVPRAAPRRMVASAADVAAARKAAHARGAPSRALCYALQFESALRQWDVAGQWWPLDAAVLSDVVFGPHKWVGLRWEHIGPDLVLRVTPSKTEETSNAKVTIDLKLCPMVMEELQHFPVEKRTGPVIVNERTGLPYQVSAFRRGWHGDSKLAGLPAGLWSRDLRASAVTEARSGGATTDDAARVAGHSKSRITADVYDRETLEAHRRMQAARIKARGEG